MTDLDAHGAEMRDGLRYPWPQPPASGEVYEVAPGVFLSLIHI